MHIIRKFLVISSILLLVMQEVVGQETVLPAKEHKGVTYIKNATIHVGNGKLIENGTIKIKDGKISQVYFIR